MLRSMNFEDHGVLILQSQPTAALIHLRPFVFVFVFHVLSGTFLVSLTTIDESSIRQR
jgi:hypothetical protein